MDGLRQARRGARALAVQALYQVELAGVSPTQGVRTAARLGAPEETIGAEGQSAPQADLAYAEEIVAYAWGHRGEVDTIISGTSTHWKLSRLGRTEVQVLRVATAEMLRFPDVPPAVVMDEAVDLARAFAGDEAARFVNGVVDAIGPLGRGLAPGAPRACGTIAQSAVRAQAPQAVQGRGRCRGRRVHSESP